MSSDGDGRLKDAAGKPASAGAAFVAFMRFVDRVGGVLVAPKMALSSVLAGEGGISDVLWLFLLRLFSGDGAPYIARALLGAPSLGLVWAVRGMLQAAMTLLPDLLGILVGGVVLAVVTGRRARGRELDLAACAWIPFLVVRVLAEMVFALLHRAPSAVELRVVDVLSLGWSAVVYAAAFLVVTSAARKNPAASKS